MSFLFLGLFTYYILCFEYTNREMEVGMKIKFISIFLILVVICLSVVAIIKINKDESGEKEKIVWKSGKNSSKSNLSEKTFI